MNTTGREGSLEDWAARAQLTGPSAGSSSIDETRSGPAHARYPRAPVRTVSTSSVPGYVVPFCSPPSSGRSMALAAEAVTTEGEWQHLLDPAYQPARTEFGKLLRNLRRAYLEAGGTPLSWQEIDQLMDRMRERRG